MSDHPEKPRRKKKNQAISEFVKDFLPLSPIPPEYNLEENWWAFTENQRNILQIWMFGGVRYKSEVARRLKMDVTHVTEFINSPRAIAYRYNYNLKYNAEKDYEVLEAIHNRARDGNDRDARLWAEIKGYINHKNQTNIQVNNSGNDNQIQINILPVKSDYNDD